MSTVRQLEERLRAWQTFRGIAGATRTLAAAQSMHWTEVARRAEAHLARCVELRDAYPEARPAADAPRLLVGLGSDLGLCGPFNRVVAQRLAVEQARGFHTQVVVGERLRTHVDMGVLALPAATSFEQVQALAAQLELLLASAGPTSARLVLVLAVAVDPDGRPRVAVLDEPDPAGGPTPDRAQSQARTRSAVELVSPEQTAAMVVSLTRHARLAAALARSAASETEARWRTMNRAHEAADRRIGEQEREISKQRQELVTQEMLEARQGARTV